MFTGATGSTANRAGSRGDRGRLLRRRRQRSHPGQRHRDQQKERHRPSHTVASNPKQAPCVNDSNPRPRRERQADGGEEVEEPEVEGDGVPNGFFA